MKATFNKTFFWTFVALWIVVTIVNLAAPARTFSENENRKLAKIPAFSLAALLDGSYMGKLEEYGNDHFVWRDFWVSVNSGLEYLTGKREINGVFVGKNALMSNLGPPREAYVQENIEGIRTLWEVTGLPVSVMIVPSAAEIQPDKLPVSAEVWDQAGAITGIYESLGAFTCLPVHETLRNHRDAYLYYRTDHHWTTYGAYLAYLDYCEVKGLSPVEYDPVTVSDAFNGTLYSSSGVRFIQSDVIEAPGQVPAATCTTFDGQTVTEYDSVLLPEFLEKKDKYSYFLGTNQPVVTLRRKDGEGPRLLMFKDSYAHCMAPMLLNHYSEIVLIDLRYINQQLDQFVSPGEFDEVLFLYSVDSFVSQDNIAKLSYLLS